MFKYSGRTIRPGRSWTDNNGITHPSNWHIWSADAKAAAGVTEIVEETPPDSRFYIWSQNSDGTTNKTAKSLADSGSGETLVLGVKSSLKNTVQSHQYSLLAETDWAIIRKADKGTAIPSNIQTWRDAIRDKATEMGTAIDNSTDTDAVAALFLSRDEDGNKSGILYDWPELEK